MDILTGQLVIKFGNKIACFRGEYKLLLLVPANLRKQWADTPEPSFPVVRTFVCGFRVGKSSMMGMFLRPVWTTSTRRRQIAIRGRSLRRVHLRRRASNRIFLSGPVDKRALLLLTISPSGFSCFIFLELRTSVLCSRCGNVEAQHLNGLGAGYDGRCFFSL